jgi:hypothetical protein
MGRNREPESRFRPIGGGCASPPPRGRRRAAPQAIAGRHAPRPPSRRRRWAATRPPAPRSQAGRSRPRGTRRTGPLRDRRRRRRSWRRSPAAASTRRWLGSRRGPRGRGPAATSVPASKAVGRCVQQPVAGDASRATPAAADGAGRARNGASCAPVERWRGDPPPSSRPGPAAPRPAPHWRDGRPPASSLPHVRARPLPGGEPLLSSPVAQASFLQFVSPGPRGPFSCAERGGPCQSASVSSLTLVPASRQLP